MLMRIITIDIGLGPPHCPPMNDAPSTPITPRRRVDVRELLAGAAEVILLHQGQEYRLRLTRSGKLILTK